MGAVLASLGMLDAEGRRRRGGAGTTCVAALQRSCNATLCPVCSVAFFPVAGCCKVIHDSPTCLVMSGTAENNREDYAMEEEAVEAAESAGFATIPTPEGWEEESDGEVLSSLLVFPKVQNLAPGGQSALLRAIMRAIRGSSAEEFEARAANVPRRHTSELVSCLLLRPDADAGLALLKDKVGAVLKVACPELQRARTEVTVEVGGLVPYGDKERDLVVAGARLASNEQLQVGVYEGTDITGTITVRETLGMPFLKKNVLVCADVLERDIAAQAKECGYLFRLVKVENAASKQNGYKFLRAPPGWEGGLRRLGHARGARALCRFPGSRRCCRRAHPPLGLPARRGVPDGGGVRRGFERVRLVRDLRCAPGPGLELDHRGEGEPALRS